MEIKPEYIVIFTLNKNSVKKFLIYKLNLLNSVYVKGKDF